jgi:mannitol 2-dehydrogenase
LPTSRLTLAYPALLLGIPRVEDAVADPVVRALLLRFLHDEAVPAVVAATGLDARAYAEDVVRRFANPAIGDTTARLAGGGSAKLPRFLLPTLQANAAAGRPVGAAALVLAAWAHALLADPPPAEEDLPALRDLARRAAADPVLLLAEGPLAAAGLHRDPRVAEAVSVAHAAIADRGVAAAIGEGVPG